MSESEGDEPVHALKFRVGSEYYCVAIDAISEVVQKEDELRMIPNAPDHSLGVQSYHDDPMEVLKLDIAFDVEEEAEDDDPFVIALSEEFSRDGHRIGWFVEKIFEIIEINPRTVDTSFDDDGVFGTVANNGDVVMWVDPETLFDGDDISYLDDVSPDGEPEPDAEADA